MTAKWSSRTRSRDKLFNIDVQIPPRPTISNVRWMTGTLYVTPADMDALSESNCLPSILSSLV